VRFNKSLVLIVIVFALLGIAVIDGSSLLFAKWQLSDFGDVAASDGADAYAGSKSVDSAKQVAQATLDDRQSGANVTKVTVDPRTSEITFIIKKDANALFIDKVGATEEWVHLTSVKTVPIPTP
jgi:Flp pilus assembly protein TadG